MRIVRIDIDADGRSFVATDGPPDEVMLISASPDALTATRDVLPAMPPTLAEGETAVARLDVRAGSKRAADNYRRSEGRVPALDLAPGGSRWSLVHYSAGVTATVHETATLDYDLVLSGSVELVLDSGPVTLLAGDAVLIPGARHGWRTRSEPCVLAVVMQSLDSGVS